MGKLQSAQGSGKDEQFYAAIYAHEFSARVVQLEHDGRKRAEAIVPRLWQLLFRQLGTTSSIRRRQNVWGFHPFVPRAHNALASIKRCQSDSEQGQRPTWIRSSESSGSRTTPATSSPRRRHRRFKRRDARRRREASHRHHQALGVCSAMSRGRMCVEGLLYSVAVGVEGESYNFPMHRRIFAVTRTHTNPTGSSSRISGVSHVVIDCASSVLRD